MTFLEACESGDLDWLKCQKASGTLGDLNEDSDYEYIFTVIESGNLEVLKWLIEDSGQKISISNNELLRFAAEAGFLDIFMWTLGKCSYLPVILAPKSVLIDAIQSVAEYGHLELLEWLLKETKYSIDVTKNDEPALYLSVINDHTAAVRYLLLNSKSYPDITEYLAESNEATYNVLTAFDACHKADIPLSILRKHPDLLDLAETGADLELIAKLTSRDLEQLLNVSKIAKSTSMSPRL